MGSMKDYFTRLEDRGYTGEEIQIRLHSTDKEWEAYQDREWKRYQDMVSFNNSFNRKTTIPTKNNKRNK